MDKFDDTTICYTSDIKNNQVLQKQSNTCETIQHNFFNENPITYEISDKLYAANELQKNIAFFQIQLTDDINLQKDMFSINVWQSGNHLKNYRNLDYSKRYVPSQVSLTLLHQGAEKTTILKCFSSLSQSNPSLIFSREDTSIKMLRKDTYVLIVDYRWNYVARENAFLKAVNLSINSPSPLTFTNIEAAKGLKLLKKAMTDHSTHEKSLTQFSKKKNFTGVMNYAYSQLCTRPIKNSWFTYLIVQNGLAEHERNQIKQQLVADLTFKTIGMQLIASHAENEWDEKCKLATVSLNLAPD